MARQYLGLALLTALFVTGCNDGRPTRVPVSGKVIIDGAPATKGSVEFYPRSGQGRPSAAQIQSDGSFSMFTFEANDGVPPGDYDVVVSSMEIGEDAIRYHLPKKYASRHTSGITKTVQDPIDSMLIELSWEGKPGPYVERYE